MCCLTDWLTVVDQIVAVLFSIIECVFAYIFGEQASTLAEKHLVLVISDHV